MFSIKIFDYTHKHVSVYTQVTWIQWTLIPF